MYIVKYTYFYYNNKYKSFKYRANLYSNLTEFFFFFSNGHLFITVFCLFLLQKSLLLSEHFVFWYKLRDLHNGNNKMINGITHFQISPMNDKIWKQHFIM